MPTLEKKFSITFIIDNVPDVELGKLYSKPETHFNIPWQVNFYRDLCGLSISLSCMLPCEEKEWSIRSRHEFQLISENGSFMSTIYERSFLNDAQQKITGWEHAGLIKWERLEENFMVDSKVTLKVNVQILGMTGFGREKIRNFDESNKDLSDVVLKVEEEKFYVSKAFLAFQSVYFKKLLLGDFKESKQTEVVLEYIDVEDFQSFLELLHGESSINDENIEEVLHLADMYDSPTAIRRCEEFLLEKSKLELVEKLRLASKYNCQGLKETILSRVLNKSEIDKILSDDVCKMDPSIAVVLLQKKLEKAERLKKKKSIKKASIFSCFRNA